MITIPEIAGRFRRYHKAHHGWGPLSAVLGGPWHDRCVDRRVIMLCIRLARAQGDEEAVALAGLLLCLSPRQRRRLPHVAAGWPRVRRIEVTVPISGSRCTADPDAIEHSCMAPDCRGVRRLR